MNKKTILIFILLLVLAISLIAVGIFFSKQPGSDEIVKPKEDKKYVPNESLLKDIESEQLKITEIDIKKIEDYYEFNFTISNTSTTQTAVQIIYFVFYDKKNNEVGRIENELQPVLPNQPINYIINSKDEKLFNASTIKIELSPLIVE